MYKVRGKGVAPLYPLFIKREEWVMWKELA